jgi:NAD(P)-dependent dehydrogenase (short-subunit alcohol dehydrogenase family)
MSEFDGKVIFVTGAGSGIGRCAALLLGERGAAVAAVDVNPEAAEATASELGDRGGRAIGIAADVSVGDDVAAAVAQTVERLGGLDGAFNNAGVPGAASLLHEMPDDGFDRTVAVNLRGVFLCVKHQLAHMREHGGGSIVNTSSRAGLVGFEGSGDYSATKFGIIGLSKTAAIENAKAGIRVNALCPGTVRTPMLEAALGERPGLEEAIAGQNPFGRPAEEKEIAEAAAWLLSGAASFVSGEALSVDGGWAAW